MLSQVAQWSDLVVFDFLTGNYDRVSSMQVSNHLCRYPIILYSSIIVVNVGD